MGAKGWLAAGLSAIGLSACSLLLDTSGLDGAAAGADAQAADASSADAGADALDAAADASGDAGTDAPAGDAGGGCRDTFFDDFDGDASVGAGWDGLSPGGAEAAYDDADALSLPRSLLVTVPDSASTGTVGLKRQISAASKDVCCELAIRSTASNVSVVALSGLGGDYTLGLSYGSGTFVANEHLYGNVVNRVIGDLPTSSAWERVRVEASLPAGKGKGTLRVYVGGALALSDQLGDPAYDVSIQTLEIGSLYASSSAATRTVRFDDVGCTAR